MKRSSGGGHFCHGEELLGGLEGARALPAGRKRMAQEQEEVAAEGSTVVAVRARISGVGQELSQSGLSPPGAIVKRVDGPYYDYIYF